MSIKVLFFGAIADKLGTRSLVVPEQKNMRLSDVLQQAGCESYRPFLVAVNQEQVNDEQQFMHAGDEVAIMPPFSGG